MTCDETNEASRLVASKLSAFLKTLRDNAFAVGLKEGQDAARLMASGYAERPALLRSAFKHLFSARRSDWEKFDGLFDAFWLGQRVKSRSLTMGSSKAANSPSLKTLQDAGAARERGDGATEQLATPDDAPEARDGEGRMEGASRVDNLANVDFRKIADPAEIAHAHEAAARLARVMRTRLTRRDRATRRGRRLDLRRTIHANISHGGAAISLVKAAPQDKPLRLVVLLDASGSMSMYTGVFVRFIHGVLDEFRQAEAFLFHTRLAHVSDAMKERDAGARARSAGGDGAGRRRRHPDRRKPRDLQSLARRARHPFAHLRHDRVRRLRNRRRGAARPRDGGSRRRCRRIVWLNPMMGWRDYAPEAAGIKAALPYVDLYAPANTLASLAALEPYLAKL